MNERSISLGKVVTIVLWLLVSAFMLAAWVAWMAGAPDRLPGLLGLTAGAIAPVAAVAHIHGYVARTCRLIRLVHGVGSQPEDEPGLRAIV